MGFSAAPNPKIKIINEQPPLQKSFCQRLLIDDLQVTVDNINFI